MLKSCYEKWVAGMFHTKCSTERVLFHFNEDLLPLLNIKFKYERIVGLLYNIIQKRLIFCENLINCKIKINSEIK